MYSDPWLIYWARWSFAHATAVSESTAWASRISGGHFFARDTLVSGPGTGRDTTVSLFRDDIQRKLVESGLRRNPVLSLDYLSL